LFDFDKIWHRVWSCHSRYIIQSVQGQRSRSRGRCLPIAKSTVPYRKSGSPKSWNQWRCLNFGWKLESSRFCACEVHIWPKTLTNSHQLSKHSLQNCWKCIGWCIMGLARNHWRDVGRPSKY